MSYEDGRAGQEDFPFTEPKREASEEETKLAIIFILDF